VYPANLLTSQKSFSTMRERGKPPKKKRAALKSYRREY